MSDFYNNDYSNTDISSDISSDSEYDSDIDEALIYDAEELSNTKFNIILCIFVPNLYYHLVIIRFKLFDIEFIKKFKDMSYLNETKIEISQCIYLDTQECVAIIKTIWLKLIQRTWKKIYKIKKNIITLRKMPLSIRCREITGKWPSNCFDMPSLHGMLSYLKNINK
jgi:hypothetical protein